MFQVVVKELRESAGYSQTNFAKALGVSQSTVGMWESGRNKPTYSMLVKIANTLGVSLGYLLDESNDVLAGASTSSGNAEIKRIAMPDSSLAPEIHSGDVLLCSPCNKFANGKIMAFKRAGSIIVRKIVMDEGMYLAVGFAPNAQPIIITDAMLESGEITVIGHIIEIRRKCK